MLTLSLRQASSSSSLAKMSAIFSVREENRCDLAHHVVFCRGNDIVLRILCDLPWLLLREEGSDMHSTPSNSSWRLYALCSRDFSLWMNSALMTSCT